MRRFVSLISTLAVVLATVFAFSISGNAAAQDAVDSDHALVGTWQLVTSPEEPELVTIANFTADGSYSEIDAEGVGFGRWEATGDLTADLNVFYIEGDSGASVVRAAIDIAEDGQSLTATYTYEFTSADGESSGEYGPGTATGTKLSVEPMGDPIGSLEDLFGQFEGSPEPATPES